MPALLLKARQFLITILIIALVAPFFLAPPAVFSQNSPDFPLMIPSNLEEQVKSKPSSKEDKFDKPAETVKKEPLPSPIKLPAENAKSPAPKVESPILPPKPVPVASPVPKVTSQPVTAPVKAQTVEPEAPPPAVVTDDPAMPDANDPLLKDALSRDESFDTAQDASADEGNWQEEAFENLGEDIVDESEASKFSFLDQEPATATYIPGYGFDYRSYPEKMAYLSKRILRMRDALESSLNLDIAINKSEVASLVKSAEVEKTKFEYYSLSNDLYKAGRAYGNAVEKLNRASLRTSISPTVEGRAIWLDRGSIVDAETPARLKKAIRRIHDAGINVVYFETVNAGFPIYPSKIARQNPLTEDWDPLQVAIEEGHRLGMEIHAWVWVFAVGNRRHNPIIGKSLDWPGPILDDAGMMSEAMRSSTGGLLPGGSQHEFWLSPASPKARKFLLDLYSEIVSNYDVDGLQLDYIRYPFQKPSVQMGYEPISRQRYYSAFGGKIEDPDAMGEFRQRSWIAWKTYLVNSFVKETAETLKKIKPDLKLSAAVFPMARSSRIVAIHQDWETWIENGWIDTLSPMSYTTSPSKLMRTFNYVNRATKKHTMVYPGIAIHKIDAPDLLTQLDSVRSQGAMGSTLFAMAHLDENKARVLEDGPYKEKNVVSPHQQPVKAMHSLLNDYRTKFNKLHEGDTPLNIPAELNTQMTATLNSIHQQLGSYHPAVVVGQPPPLPSKAFVTGIENDLKQLRAQNKQWIDLEYKKHPYRLDYFSQLLIRMERVLSYIKDRSV